MTELTYEKAKEKFTKQLEEDENKLVVFRDYMVAMHLHHQGRFGENIDWENMSINEKVYHGWLIHVVKAIDAGLNQRWAYWQDIIFSGKIEDKPIPQIDIHKKGDEGFDLTMNMIRKCLDPPNKGKYGGHRLMKLFVDWILYGLGSQRVEKLPNEIDDELNEYWYENFKADLMIMYPGDYFVRLANEMYPSGKFNVNGFYSTPPHIVEMMIKIMFADIDKKQAKYEAIHEPALGSGVFLLHASNYSLRMCGQDIDPFMVKLATLNGYFYVPWLVKMPDDIRQKLSKLHDKNKKGGINYENVRKMG